LWCAWIPISVIFTASKENFNENVSHLLLEYLSGSASDDPACRAAGRDAACEGAVGGNLSAIIF